MLHHGGQATGFSAQVVLVPDRRLGLVLLMRGWARIYIVDSAPAKADAVGGALRAFFRGPAKPAGTWIGVAALADPAFLIEIEATAVLD